MQEINSKILETLLTKICKRCNKELDYSKFHQAILEQKVQLDQALQLARDYENAKLDRELMILEIEELKEVIDLKNFSNFNKKKKEIELKKKEIALSFKDYDIANMKNTLTEYLCRK